MDALTDKRNLKIKDAIHKVIRYIAYVHGALNIIRKSEPNAFQKRNADGVGGCGLHPLRVNPLGGIIL